MLYVFFLCLPVKVLSMYFDVIYVKTAYQGDHAINSKDPKHHAIS